MNIQAANILTSTPKKKSKSGQEGIPSVFTPLKTNRGFQDQVILLLDVVENTSKKVKKDKKDLLERLQQNNVNCEQRKLAVGDVMWILRKSTGEEFVLQWIVERKRMDDLSNSIIDKRYKEQKYRLSNCGVKNVFLLVEGSVRVHENQGRGLDANTLESALFSSSYGTHSFLVKQTKNLEDSLTFFMNMTKQIERLHRKLKEGKISKEQFMLDKTFDSFNSDSDKSKNLNVRDIFGKQLMQMKGVSRFAWSCS